MSQIEQAAYHDSMLYRIRHSTAHVMAEAVLDAFPDCQDRHRPGDR